MTTINTLTGVGYHQRGLAQLFKTLRANLNGILAKLDLDGGVTDTDYAALWGMAAVEGLDETGLYIRDNGVIVRFLTTFRTKFNGMLAKLDDDAGVTDTDYESVLAIAAVTGEGKGIQNAGINQGVLIKHLDNIIAAIAAFNAKADADLTGTDYAALWNVTDNVDSTGCKTTFR